MKTFLRINVGEWPGVELNGFDCDEIEGKTACLYSVCGACAGLTAGWADILEFSYTLAEEKFSHHQKKGRRNVGCVAIT